MINPGALNPLRSALMMLGACSLIAATTILAKSLGTDLLGEPLHPLQVSAGRFLFALVGLLCASFILRPKIQSPAIKLHFGRTFFGWAGGRLS